MTIKTTPPVKKRTRGNPIPLIVEPHPVDYTGYPFITLIQYRDIPVLAIVDNADKKMIKSFILDLCGPAQVDEEHIVEIAYDWYANNRDNYPISFEFSKLGMMETFSQVYRTFNTEFVTRVIGPLPKFEMNAVKKVRRRRRKPVPPGIEVHKKLLTDHF